MSAMCQHYCVLWGHSPVCVQVVETDNKQINVLYNFR